MALQNNKAKLSHCRINCVHTMAKRCGKVAHCSIKCCHKVEFIVENECVLGIPRVNFGSFVTTLVELGIGWHSISTV